MISEKYTDLITLFYDAPHLFNSRVDEYIYIVKEAEKRGFRIPGNKFQVKFSGENKTVNIFSVIPGEVPEKIYDDRGFTKFFEDCCKIVNEFEPKIFSQKNLYSFDEIKEKGIEKLKDEAYVNYFKEKEEGQGIMIPTFDPAIKIWKPRHGEDFKGFHDSIAELERLK